MSFIFLLKIMYFSSKELTADKQSGLYFINVHFKKFTIVNPTVIFFANYDKQMNQTIIKPKQIIKMLKFFRFPKISLSVPDVIFQYL
jgi:hypothetical protein